RPRWSQDSGLVDWSTRGAGALWFCAHFQLNTVIVVDENGRKWVIYPGDPMYDLLSAIPVDDELKMVPSWKMTGGKKSSPVFPFTPNPSKSIMNDDKMTEMLRREVFEFVRDQKDPVEGSTQRGNLFISEPKHDESSADREDIGGTTESD